jgi:TolB-like protein/DNA-binding SARP family transcriptional activator
MALSGAGVDVGVVAGVESRVESGASAPGLRLQLLGPFGLSRAGELLELPPSRKVRGLLAYLALASHDLARSTLSELLWELPNDPRGELRWSLSKLRGALDEPGRVRLLARGDQLRLDRSDVQVDVREVTEALQAGVTTLPTERLRQLAALLAQGEFLEGQDLARGEAFNGWLLAQRRRLRSAQATLLEQLAARLPVGSDEAVAALEQWLRVAPFDPGAHERLLDALAATGRMREGDEHLAAVARQFGQVGQDWAPIGVAWREARRRHASPAAAAVSAAAATPPAAAAGSGAAVAGGDAPVLLVPANVADAMHAAPRRASLLVMPFAEQTQRSALRGGLGDGLAHDIITRLAKLRSVAVIAQGTAFALDERQLDAEEAARHLDVDYLASGTLRREPGGRIGVNAQLADRRTGHILWADHFGGRLDDAFAVLDEIGDRIVASIAGQIELAERNRALLKAPDSLDAWEAHHRGLWHMVRFSRDDNERARQFFETAVRLDPTFARPYAGISFTHFQRGFLGWGERAVAEEMAYRSAAQGLLADERDPSAHWAMGRALWLRGRHDEAVAELDTCVALSPNFALGHYMLSFVHAQSGDARLAVRESDQSRALSPYDPLLFAMLGARAMGLMRLGRHEEAAAVAMQAAAQPNAHVHILGIAMHCLTLAGREAEARAFAAVIQRLQPGYAVDDFLRAFRFDDEGRALVERAAKRIARA